MQKSTLLTVLMFCTILSFGQDISITFSGTGAATQIDSVTATNLRTDQRVTLPGNQTLTLTAITGIPMFSELNSPGMVYPNPFSGKTTFTAFVQKTQTVDLQVRNLVGQVVAQAQAAVQVGENKFAISVSLAGIYIVSCATDSGTTSFKVICTGAATPENSIQFLGSDLTNHNNQNNQNNQNNHNNHNDPALLNPASQPKPKSSQTGYSLGYQPGDLINYRCYAGIHTTILTKIPSASENYEVRFVACTDPDGKHYSIVKIGEQTWMAENLAYIPAVSPSADQSDNMPFYYVYDYQGTSVNEARATTNFANYGVLYNWPAAMNGSTGSTLIPSGVRGICPSGWFLPSDAEWTVLTDALGTSPGGKMKETGTMHWLSPNTGSTNESGFTALPGGYQNNAGGFDNIGNYALFWSSSESSDLKAWRYLLYSGDSEVGRWDFSQSYGFSVRCLFVPNLPDVITVDIKSISTTSATSGGNVTSDGGASITARGVCWSTAANPTISDSKTTDGTGTGSFTSNITLLTGNTTFHVRAYATNSSGTAYGNEVSFKTSPVPADLLTTAISDITRTTASSGGTITNDGGAYVYARGVCWSSSPNPTTADDKTTDGTGTGSFISRLTGLTGNTTYHVRAYATNSAGTSYGSEVSFKTSPVLANLITAPISTVTQTTASSGGTITNEGGTEVTARGVCWSTSINPTIAESKTTDGTGPGEFTSNLTGLTGNTTYHVRAYATNSVGTSYGSDISFKTSPILPTVTTTTVTAITQTTASSGGTVTDDGGADITARGVCWSISLNPTTADSKTTDGTGTGSFTSSLTGLTGNTSYFVRAYAINSVGTSYGPESIFTTSPVLPSVNTSAVTAITQSTAFSGGTVTDDGGADITSRGVCWSTSANPTTVDDKTADGTGTGEFTSFLTGLTGNTTYFGRAYATNSAGTSYGNEVSFKTSPVLPIVTTAGVTAITQVTASSGGSITDDGGSEVFARGVCWSTSESPTTDDSKTTDDSGTGSFTSSLTGLTGNTTYHIRAYATNGVGTSYGPELSFKTSPVLPTVTTKDVSSITQTTASSGGTVTDDGGANLSVRGVCWSTSANPTTDDSKTTDGSGSGVFTSSLTGLTGNTTYYVRAYATNSVGTSYGPELSFKTSPVLPTITSTVVSAITQTTASSGGTITDDGGSEITSRGVCWSTSANPTTNDNKTLEGTGTGSFTSSLAGLTGNTTYYIRPYATNSAGTSYGPEVSFKTSPVPPSLTTTPLSNITQTTASSGGIITTDGGAGVTVRGVCWSTSAKPTTADNKTEDGTGAGAFTSMLTGLTGNTNYFVRAYATNNIGTNYGDEISFSTSAVLPTVLTAAISSITQITAVSGGTITSDGGAEISARGVCWSILPNPTTAYSKTTEGIGIGSFTSILTGLAGNTTYYVRCYATNSAGTSYGNEVSFVTSPILPAISTEAVTAITQTTATSGGNSISDGGAEITARGVCWSTLRNPTTIDSKTTDGIGSGSFTSNITGLTRSTTYYVRAYATNSVGTNYGSEVSFKTIEAPPALTTAAVSGITQTTAVSGGNITDDGGADISARGVCWSISSNPALTDSHTADGTGVGLFTSSLTGLSGNTTYYVRAYATNSAGTTYGNEVSFLTSPVLPTVTTRAVTVITPTSASSGGNVTADGGAAVTARGICWSTTPIPTTADSKTANGAGTGLFTSGMAGLIPNTTYYVRAYATNTSGTNFGEEVTFTTLEASGSFTDPRDSKVYLWETIGTQKWMTENLAYLPSVSPPSERSETSPYYYVYGYEGSNLSEAKATAYYTDHGVLNNWEAARAACPSGWHLPNDAEWTILTDYLINNGYGYGGSGSDIGKSMSATSGWTSYATAGTIGNNQSSNNRSSFKVLPGGYQNGSDGFFGLGNYAYFWSASEFGPLSAWCRSLHYDADDVSRSFNSKSGGFSVRCVQN